MPPYAPLQKPVRMPGAVLSAVRVLALSILAVTFLGATLPAGSAMAADGSTPAPVCDYRITLSGPDARALAVAADCVTERPLELRPRTALLRRHLADLTVNGIPVAMTDLFAWTVAPVSGRVRFGYRYRLDQAAAESGSVEGARRFGRSVVAPLRSWLLGPAGPTAELRLRLEAPQGGQILTGLNIDPDGHARLRSDDLDYAGYALLGSFRSHRFDLPAAAQAPGLGPAWITLALPDVSFALSEGDLLEWVRRSAQVVAGHWGGMPTRRAMLLLVPEPSGEGVLFGRVRGGGGATGYISLGVFTRREQLYESWELIHELMHLGTPFLHDGFWFMEGFATYAEPVARARAGWRSETEVWEEFVRNMPRGLPALARGPGEEGLGGRSVDAIYWGGALFMLLADVAIRVQSGNRQGLMDCMLAVLQAGGDVAHRWSLAQALHKCDAGSTGPGEGLAGGGAVAHLLQQQVLGQRPLALDALWQDLGVHPVNGGIILADDAPLADIRRAITAPVPALRQ